MALLCQDRTQDRRGREDLGGLAAAVGSLVGEPLHDLRFSYGGELALHFGSPVPYETKRFGVRYEGSFVLGVRASAWRMNLSNPPLTFFFEPEDASGEAEASEEVLRSRLVEVASSLKGKRVAWAEPFVQGGPHRPRPGFGLAIAMSDGSSFVVLPFGPQEPDDLADWELFTPFHHLLEAGPGLNWSYRRSDDPDETGPGSPPTE